MVYLLCICVFRMWIFIFFIAVAFYLSTSLSDLIFTTSINDAYLLDSNVEIVKGYESKPQQHHHRKMAIQLDPTEHKWPY